MNSEDVILSDISLSLKDTFFVIPFTSGEVFKFIETDSRKVLPRG
jgi:hypothetical protein